MIGGADNSPATGTPTPGAYKSIAWTGIPLYAKFFFQLVFAGTAATIVSGAVAERIKYLSFIVFSFLLVAFVYPITGHWIWGGGWLAAAGFWDFAGSTVVHSVGGWAALAGHPRPRAPPRQVRPRRQGERRSPAIATRRASSAASSCGSAGSASTPDRRWPRTPTRSRTSS